MASSSRDSRFAWLAAGVAAGAAGAALLSRMAAKRGEGRQARVEGRDFRGRPSSYVRASGEAVVGLLAYDVCKPLTEEQYDRWLFDEHYHDLMANPHLEKLVLHTVSKDKKAKLSSGATIENKVGFYRLCELHFRNQAAYDSYIEWFKTNVIPQERTPAGKSAFQFYHLSEFETISRGSSPAALTAPRPSAASASASAAAPAPVTSPDVTAAAAAAAAAASNGHQSSPSARGAGAEQTVLVVGSSGNIGGEIVRQLRARGGLRVLEASRRASVASGQVPLDIADVASMRALDVALPGGIDHVVVCCGASTFGALETFDSGNWESNCAGKLMAVSRLIVMLANGQEVKCLRAGGSVTVTTGQSARTVNRMWPGLALNNAGLDSFIRCCGVNPPRGVRINAVSPALVRETAEKAGLPLAGTVPAPEVAAKYLELILGNATGQVVDAGAQTVFEKSHQTS